MAWISLVAAGVFEMLGVTSINLIHKYKNVSSIFVMLLSFTGSFVFLSIAMESLSMGVAYSVWTGIGAAGGAIMGMIFYGEQKDRKRIFFITLIIVSVMGLKFIS